MKLHSAENAWKPSVKAPKNAAENGEDPKAELSRKARAILNKLTPQKFDQLVKKFDDLSIVSEDDLQLCMNLVFEKVGMKLVQRVNV